MKQITTELHEVNYGFSQITIELHEVNYPNIMKLIPYGQSNYEIVATQNFYYIDKTPYIAKIESMGSRFLFFLRPRRFGKSLFLSMLEHYYDIERKDEFDNLFGETWIGKNPTPLRNTYPVLKLSFSGIIILPKIRTAS